MTHSRGEEQKQSYARAVALTQALVREDTVNPPGNELRCADLVHASLEEAGFEVARYPLFEGRPNLVARIKGAGTGLLPIAFTGHLDTVPLGAQSWNQDPFGADIVGDRLYGRGSTDMKGGVAAFVEACILRREELAAGSGAVLIITAAEETGCEGAFSLARTPGALEPVGALVVAEPTANEVCVGHKGALWLQVKFKGVAAHGSMPEKGVNAIVLAARAILRLGEFAFGQEPHPALGHPTLNVGTIQGGLNINSVPDRAEFSLDIRTLPGQLHDGITCEIARALGEEVSLDPFLDLQAIWTEPSNPWIRDVIAALGEANGARGARGVPYFTDAAALQLALGPTPTIILGPGEPHLAHQTDEYCHVWRIKEAVDIYTLLIDSWCEQ